MKNFKYLIIFIFSLLFLKTSLFALKINGRTIEDSFEESYKKKRTTLRIRTCRDRDTHLKTSWEKPRGNSSLKEKSSSSAEELPVRLRASTDSRLRRSTSVRTEGSNKLNQRKKKELTSSSKMNERSEIEGKDGRESSSSMIKPLSDAKKPSLLEQLEEKSKDLPRASLKDFNTAGSDATLRNIGEMVEALGKVHELPAPDDTIIVSISLQKVDLDGRKGFLTLNQSTSIVDQEYRGFGENQPLTVQVSGLCSFEVFPCDLRTPLILKSGIYEPQLRMLDITFENCRSVIIKPIPA